MTSAFVIYQFGVLLVYPVLQVFAVALTCSVVLVKVGLPASGDTPFRSAARGLRLTGPAGVGQIFSGVYINGSVLIVALANSAAVTEFSSANRIYLAGLTLTAPVLQFAVAFVGRRDREFDKRVRNAVWTQLLLSVLVFMTVWSLFDTFFGFMFGREVAIPSGSAVMSAAAIAIVMVSRAVGSHLLLASGRVRVFSVSAVLGAVLGVILIPIFARVHGAAGAMLAVLCTELVVLVVQLCGVVAATKRGLTIPKMFTSVMFGRL
ncbi:lipopolysaccharide biosynthesis protein [Gordonia sputi]